MSKKPMKKENLPSVSKQTAEGITGAVIGGMVAGPVGAIAGGVAGALIGNSSAKGEKPMKHAMETIRAAGKRGAKAIETAGDRKKSRTAKVPAAEAASQPSLTKQKAKPATKKLQKTAKVASKPESKGNQKRAKKKT